MRHRAIGRWCSASAVTLVLTLPARAVQLHGGAHDPVRTIPADVLQRPIGLKTGIGSAHDEVTTALPEARAFYDQGISYLHSYGWVDAARSFTAALQLDPALAMAWIGLSRAFSGLGASRSARDAAERASALAANAGRREQIRIALRVQQLDAADHPDRPADAAVYKSALDRALQAFPGDVELLLLRGEAEDASGGSPGMGAGESAIAFFERAAAAAADYFAPHHYLVHAYENLGAIDRARAHAEIYVTLCPRVPHAHHMLGHVLRRSGRMTEAIHEFRLADDLATEYFSSDGIPAAYDWNYHHNLDLLGTSYQYRGQMRNAEPILRRSFEVPSLTLGQELNKREWPAFLLARGAEPEALVAANGLAGHESPVVRAIGYIAAAKIHMAGARLSRAAQEIDAALRELRTAGPEAGALAEDFRLVQGEFFLRSGDREKADPMIREAVRKLRAQTEPDQWMQTLFNIDSVAAAAREAGDWTLASALADIMREYDPSFGGTQYAIACAAEHRGESAAAKEGFRLAVQFWNGADEDWPPAVDARRRLETFK